ncbi:hypothetical protein GR7B_00091 [Vibrio phage vB_VcorM_GR7B]|nr:hypothetical protein GR7B_00091 [Vibrio phage vB_VcorM_GR7B]
MASITAKVYSGNTLVQEQALETNALGDVSLTISEDLLQPSLIPYNVVFTEDGTSNYTSKNVYVQSPVIMQAAQELRLYVDRLNKHLRLDSLEFSDVDYMNWLKSGMDMYNSAARPTYITMTNARGAIYGYWMMYSQLVALRIRYLEEGLTSFDYQGAAIQLTVDVTQYLENQASFIEQQIEKGIENHKAYLAKKGISSGDGSAWKGRVQGATGATLSPMIRGGGNLSGQDWHPNMNIE